MCSGRLRTLASVGMGIGCKFLVQGFSKLLA